MQKLKYRTQEGEKVLRNPTKEDLKGYDVIVAVVKETVFEKEDKSEDSLPITEKELVEKVKLTQKTNRKNK